MNVETDISTPLVKAFGFAWAAIQKNHPETPDVVITMGAGSKMGGLVLGHFAPNRWARGDKHVHELFVGGEGLNRTPEEVMGTLLHEAAHGIAAERGEQDVSRGGRYHNAKFKEIAESLGITLTYSKSLGWSTTTITPEAAKQYATAIRRLTGAMVAYRRDPMTTLLGGLPGLPGGIGGTGGALPLPKGWGRKNSNNGVVMTCACELPGANGGTKPRKIRMSNEVAEWGTITCGVCKSDFTEVGA